MNLPFLILAALTSKKVPYAIDKIKFEGVLISDEAGAKEEAAR